MNTEPPISKSKKFEERLTCFSVAVITLCKSIEPSVIALLIIKQLIRSGTSIGANYMEANNASSKKDFKNKIFICKKESQETKYWLKLLLEVIPEKEDDILKLTQECQEFILIFQKIVSTMNNY